MPELDTVKPETSRRFAGRQSDSSDAHKRNTKSPSINKPEPGSNITLERLAQSLKQESQIASTDEGIQID
jgi:hypothetical protein